MTHLDSRQIENDELQGQVVRVGRLTEVDRERLFQLMCAYYANMSRNAFEKDLLEKDWVIVARQMRTGAIMGFSTQMVLDVERASLPGWKGLKPIKVLFSGDTIIARPYWGRNPLAQWWGRLSLSLLAAESEADWYWFLISKGFRTYRFLPVFFHEFFPHTGRDTPRWATSLINELAVRRYPGRYDPEAGIIRAGKDDCHLRSGISDITSERLANRHVRFFLDRNPRHHAGDELCCIAKLSHDNFRRSAYRVIGDRIRVAL